jgi:hypothetical protein
MKLEFISPEMFEVVRTWWTQHNHPDLPYEILPDIGLAAVDPDGVMRAVGWLYGCNSAPVGWVEWITTNPANTPMESVRSLTLLLKFMSEEAKKNGINILLSTCRQKSLGRLLEKNGFAKTDDGVSHFLKLIT